MECSVYFLCLVQLLADKAMDLGVELGLEAVNRYETNVMNTASEAMDLLNAVNRRCRSFFIVSVRNRYPGRYLKQHIVRISCMWGAGT